MGVSARRVLRMRRHLLCLRPVRAGQAVGLFPARARRHLRAGRAGGRPPHPLLCELGGVAPAQPAAVAPRFSSPRRSLSVWAFLIWERIGIARGIDAAPAVAKPGRERQDNNFVFTGSKAIGSGNVSAAAVIDICLSENERRFAGYDARLLRPQVMPCLMRFARRFHAPQGSCAAYTAATGRRSSGVTGALVHTSVRRGAAPDSTRRSADSRSATRSAKRARPRCPPWQSAHNRFPACPDAAARSPRPPAFAALRGCGPPHFRLFGSR